jgi:hypothetical protein
MKNEECNEECGGVSASVLHEMEARCRRAILWPVQAHDIYVIIAQRFSPLPR